MAPKTSKSETIDARILRLLGLEDIFDIDYDTYFTLLKEALVKYGVIGKDKIPTEELELLREELKRVRGKTGRFKAKSKKINVSSIPTLKPIEPFKGDKKSDVKLLPSKLLPPKPAEKQEEVKEKTPKVKKSTSIEELVSSIRKSVDSIAKTVLALSKLLEKGFALNRRRKENQRRSEVEEGLEKGSGLGSLIKDVAGKALKPFESIFEKIFNFIFWTLLGNTFFKIIDWFSDADNKKKVNSIFRFLNDWWPAILVGFLAFATPLGGFIATITGTLIRGLFMLARVNPALTAAIALFGAGAAIPMLFPKTVDEQERKVEKAPGTKEEKIQKLKEQKQNLNWFQSNVQGMGSEIDEQIYRLETGKTKSYSGGGLITPEKANVQSLNFGGYVYPTKINYQQTKPQKTKSQPLKAFFNGGEVNTGVNNLPTSGGVVKNISFISGGGITNNSGIRITGAGPDTQLIAAQPGEVVINKRTVDAVGASNLLALNSTYGGPSANKPKFANNIRAARFGGLIKAFKDGGLVGDKDYKDKELEKHGKGIKSIDNAVSQSSPQGGSRSAKTTINMVEKNKIERRIKRIESQLQVQKALASGKGINVKGATLGTQIGTGYNAKYKGRDAIKVSLPPGGSFENEIVLAGKRYYGMRSGNDVIYTTPDERNNQSPGIFRPGGLFGGPRMSARMDYAASKNRYYSSSDGKTYANYNDAEAARKSRIRSIESQRRLDALSREGANRSSLGVRFEAEAEARREDFQKRGGLLGQMGRGISRMFGMGSKHDAADKSARIKEKQAGARAIGRYYSSSDGKYYKDYQAAQEARRARLQKIKSKKGKQGGGVLDIEEGTGYDLPGAGADRQYLPGIGRVEPKESLIDFDYVLTKDAVERGGKEKLLSYANNLNATLDPNSTSRKMGDMIKPLPSGSNGGVINLPSEVIDMRKPPSTASAGGSEVPEYGTMPKSAGNHRSMIKKLYYGIV